MKRSLLIIPTALAVGAAMAYASLKAKKKSAAKPLPQEKGAASAKNLKQGSYEFVSGYKNAATVKLGLEYDADKFFYDILDSDFPVYTSDSHVAFLSGEDFSFQLEYASFYGDEGFAGMCARESEKQPGAKRLTLAGRESLMYIRGDNIVFSIPADGFSYILVNVIKEKGNDETLEELSAEPALLEILNSITIETE